MTNNLSKIIKSKSKELGFHSCGISEARFLKEEAVHLKNWLGKSYNGNMQYMANHFEKRLDPRLLVENAKSVISVLLNYYPTKKQITETFKIAKYAYGKDYHYVMKNKLKELLKFIQQNESNVNGRAFVDSAPVMDKVWAINSGLGWIGKNSNLITKDGSFFFIGELIIDIELAYDQPIKDYCGTCNKCVEACPTNAISMPYIIDSKKCISYNTIENKEKINPELDGKLNDWIFGCDICQDVCPWNKKSSTHNESEFSPRPDLLEFTKEDWQNISEDKFKEIFKDSAVKRAKYAGLKRNIKNAT